MTKWRERRAGGSQNDGGKVLTAAMVLGKDGSNPYIIPQQLLSFVDHGRAEDVEHLSNVIDMSKQFRITACRTSKTPDKGGSYYKYVVFNRNGNEDGGKVLNIGNLFQLVDDLYNRKIVIGFTLDELIEEAERA